MQYPSRSFRNISRQRRKGCSFPTENDELARALGNPEHPGRTRGTPGSVSWVHGFPDSGGYKSRERKWKVEASEMENLNARIAKLDELESQ